MTAVELAVGQRRPPTMEGGELGGKGEHAGMQRLLRHGVVRGVVGPSLQGAEGTWGGEGLVRGTDWETQGEGPPHRP